MGSMAALSSALLGVLVGHMGRPMWASCLVVLLAAIGAFGGWIRARFGVATFIATLGLYLGLRGIASLITNTFPIPIDSSRFFYWGSGNVFGSLPVAAVYVLAIFIIIAIVAKKTVFGAPSTRLAATRDRPSSQASASAPSGSPS